MDTFPKVFDLCFPEIDYKENKSDYYFSLPNGSEIWIGGVDERERVEKVLGKEYSTVFFNECSQIPYSSITTVLTRLAEQNDLTNMAYYDENPPTKRHWSYPLFVKGLDPNSWEPRSDADNYKKILMNPEDNLANIDEDYLEILSNLPEKDRERFLKGQFTDDSSGAIYYGFDREKNVRKLDIKPDINLVFGMDFNVNPMTAVVCQIYDNKIHVIDEIYLENSNTPEMAETINKRYPGRWKVIADSTGGNRSTKGPLSDLAHLKNHGLQIPSFRNPFRVDRYAAVNNLLEKERLIIDPKCVKLIRDLEQVSYKEGTDLPETKEKHLTHISDAIGYAAHWAFPIVKIQTSATNLPR
jgi:phage terminase large subunit